MNLFTLFLYQKSMFRNLMFLIIFTSVLATSCTTKRLVADNIQMSRVSQVGYFAPLSYISVIEKGNTAIPNDSLSELAAAILDSIITDSPIFASQRKIELMEANVQLNVEVAVNNLFNQILISNQINNIKIPESLSQVLKANEERYFLATIVSGFGRKGSNYGKQVAKGIGVGILTLGLVAPIPVKSNVSLYSCIIDAERMEVVYFSRTLPLEKSPTNRKVLADQYKKLVTEYFIKK
jgi:hypothetical protein